MSNKNIDVVYVPVNKLMQADYNPRKISKESLTQLKESITRFEMVDPIIVNGAENRLNIVIGGHMRLRGAKELGYKEVPVVYVNIPDIEKEKELNIRLNKNTGEWDYEKLKIYDLNFLVDIGFEPIELGKFWDKKMEVDDDDFNEKKELASIKEIKTKPNDLIILGNHKILCGDATDPSVIKKLFGENKASMIYSDPIYNLNVNYDKGIGGKQNYGGHVIDDLSEEDYRDLIKKSLENALSVSSPSTHVFYWADQRYIWLIQTLYKEMAIENKRVCLWIKNSQNPTPHNAFNKSYEPVIYGTRGKPFISDNFKNLTEVMNKEISTGNKTFDDISDIWMVKRLSGKDYQHATSKPPKLAEKAILRCSKPNDIILDSFLGSGSTLIAAEQLKRRVYGTEIEPIFVDLSIKRWEMLTGQIAKVIRDEKR